MIAILHKENKKSKVIRFASRLMICFLPVYKVHQNIKQIVINSIKC